MDIKTIPVHLSHDPHAPEGLHWWAVAIVNSELVSCFAETYDDAMWSLHERLAARLTGYYEIRYTPNSAKQPVLN